MTNLDGIERSKLTRPELTGPIDAILFQAPTAANANARSAAILAIIHKGNLAGLLRGAHVRKITDLTDDEIAAKNAQAQRDLDAWMEQDLRAAIKDSLIAFNLYTDEVFKVIEKRLELYKEHNINGQFDEEIKVLERDRERFEMLKAEAELLQEQSRYADNFSLAWLNDRFAEFTKSFLGFSQEFEARNDWSPKFDPGFHPEAEPESARTHTPHRSYARERDPHAWDRGHRDDLRASWDRMAGNFGFTPSSPKSATKPAAIAETDAEPQPKPKHDGDPKPPPAGPAI